MAIDFRGGAFHRGLIRFSRSFQITISQMRWEDRYMEGKIPDVSLMKILGTHIVA